MVEQKAVKVYGICPKCEIGTLLFTGRVGSVVEGGEKKGEHICTNELCKEILNLNEQLPRIEFRGVDGAEDELGKKIEDFISRERKQTHSNIIVPK